MSPVHLSLGPQLISSVWAPHVLSEGTCSNQPQGVQVTQGLMAAGGVLVGSGSATALDTERLILLSFPRRGL